MLIKKLNSVLPYSLIATGLLLNGTISSINAAETLDFLEDNNTLSHSLDNLETAPMGQVNSVFQLKDVSPSDWAFEALRNLVEKYGCIAGYPDGTYKGQRALTRYEFAAGLNACLQSIERLIVGGGLDTGDLDSIRRLVQEFEAELAALGARVDNLEGRVAYLEDHQFSTTTKLVGETAFTIANAFGEDVDSEVVFHDKVRLQLVTSFSGKDKLYTRLTAGNVDNSFANQLGTNEGRYSYDGYFNNDLIIDRLHYYFPIGDNLTVYTMASSGGHHFYANTFNTGLESGGGANGALSRFGERNPIYRLGLGGQGIGLTYKIGKIAELSGGYLARGGNLPNEKSGMFDGNYSILAQLAIKPTDRIKLGLTYLNGYDGVTAGRPFNFGGTGTDLGNLNLSKALGIPNSPISSNSYGIQGQFDISSNFSIRAWGGYTDAKLIGRGDAEIWNYALLLAFPDLGKEGSMGYILGGAEPYLGGLDIPDSPDFENDVPFHFEVGYKYQLNDNISITPGVAWLTAPNQGNGDISDAWIGTVRTTFSF